MKKIIFPVFLVFILVLSGCGIREQFSATPPKPAKLPPPVYVDEQSDSITQTYMNITSSVFSHNNNIPSKYTCDGENISPQLNVSDVPEGTKSLVLISDDPDAPMGTWVHWTVWNIDPTTTEITENGVPSGAMEGVTSFGNTGYGGPCPPSGTHRYFFKLYALDTMLDLPASSQSSDIEAAMGGHILEKAELIGLYKRE